MSQYYLKPDALTNGVITKILEDNWRSKVAITKEELKNIHHTLIKCGVFGEVAESINVPIDKEKMELGEKLLQGIQAHLTRSEVEPQNKINQVNLFSHNGIILRDDIYGAAFGRFEYIYRSKGNRIFWFESGLIEYHSIYSTIDEYGFQYSAEQYDGCNIFDDTVFDDLEHSPLNEVFGNGEIFLSNLANIKADFVKDYPIEYLLYPPDVEKLSSFSIQLREQIWDAIIDLIKELAINAKSEDERFKLLNYLTNFMAEEKIQPKAYHIISLFDFYKENQLNINQIDFSKLLSLLRVQSSPVDSTINFIASSQLIKELEALPAGTEHASTYHDLIFRCLTQIFSGSLKRGRKEVPLNEGRKRVDIVFDNYGHRGFFSSIRDQYQIFCPKILIECKNYSTDPNNPEIDQLLGRFGAQVGYFGVLVCREVANKEKLKQRCKDAMNDRKGHIIFLVDNDIKVLLQLKDANNEGGIIDYLLNKWDELILNN